jgi:hypothetical protein
MIDICLVSWYLAYGMALYCMASIYYLVRTRSIGTPFNDSLTKKQRIIKNESASIRKNIFIQGIVGSILLLLVFRPFRSC